MSFMRRDHTTAGSPKFPPTCVDAHRRRASRGHVESSSECSSDYGLRAPSRGGQSVRDQLQRLLEQAPTRATKDEEPRRQLREAKKADKQAPAHSRAYGWNPCSLAKGVSSPLWKVRSLHNPKKWAKFTGCLCRCHKVKRGERHVDYKPEQANTFCKIERDSRKGL